MIESKTVTSIRICQKQWHRSATLLGGLIGALVFRCLVSLFEDSSLLDPVAAQADLCLTSSYTLKKIFILPGTYFGSGPL